jgi:hypothetical protein
MTATTTVVLVLVLVLVLLLLLLLPFAFDFPGPPSAAAETAGKTQKGRRAWMHVVFCRDRTSRQKIPSAQRTRSAVKGARTGACFLWVTFLCTSKER